MIHGKTYSYNTGGNFFKKTKNVKDKKSYILTDPSPKTIQPRFPILADHFSKNIQRSERGIEDLYLAKKPTCLKVKSLTKNIRRIKTLARQKRSRQGGVYRISKPQVHTASTKTPPPNIDDDNAKLRPPKKKQKKLPDLLDKGGTPKDYVIRKFFQDPDVESAEDLELEESKKNVTNRLRRRKSNKLDNRFNNSPPPKKTGYGVKWFPLVEKPYAWTKVEVR